MLFRSDVTVEGGAGGTAVFALLARLRLQRLAVTDAEGDPYATGLRLDRTLATGEDVVLRGMDGPGLVVIESEAELVRAAVLDNRVGILRQGESRLRRGRPRTSAGWGQAPTRNFTLARRPSLDVSATRAEQTAVRRLPRRRERDKGTGTFP